MYTTGSYFRNMPFCFHKKFTVPERIGVPRNPPRFAPKVDRDSRGNDKAKERHQDAIIFLLEHQQRITGKIGNVHLALVPAHFGRSAIHQPPHVRIKETPVGIVGVAVGVAVLVMDSMGETP